MKHLASIFVSSLAIVNVALPSHASEIAGKIAQEVTVRIEGATQGSGVIVKRKGDTYTVLTAWHVIKSNQQGEEISIYTNDEQSYNSKRSLSSQIKDLDLATITFTSPETYRVAELGDIREIKSGGDIFVAGFPIPTTAIPVSILRFLGGKVIANALGSGIPNGYELLYDNKTLPGMSGGAVLTKTGKLIGIHGLGETDSILSIQSGIAVKTGTNQAIPITYWKNITGKKPDLNKNNIDSLLARAIAYEKIPGPFTGGSGGFREPFNGYEPAIIDLANQILRVDPQNHIAYNLRGVATIRNPPNSGIVYAKISEKWYSDYRKGIKNSASINDARTIYYNDLDSHKASQLQQQVSGLSDLKVAEVFKPDHEPTLKNLFEANIVIADNQEALRYLDKLVAIDKKYLTERSYHVLTNHPEREIEGCRDLYRAAALGEARAIIELFESKTSDFKTSSVCRKYNLKLDKNAMQQVLSQLDTKITSWEKAYDFASSDDVELAFSVGNDKKKKEPFRKNGMQYILMRYARGGLKQLLGLNNGKCNDLRAVDGWDSNVMWMKYKRGYIDAVCGIY